MKDNLKKSPGLRRKRPEVSPVGNTGSNRHDRRKEVALKRLAPGLKKKQNIRDAHDKTMQRAIAKINNPKKVTKKTK